MISTKSLNVKFCCLRPIATPCCYFVEGHECKTVLCKVSLNVAQNFRDDIFRAKQIEHCALVVQWKRLVVLLQRVMQ